MKFRIRPSQIGVFSWIISTAINAQSANDPFEVEVTRKSRASISCLGVDGFTTLYSLNVVSQEASTRENGDSFILGSFGVEWTGKDDFVTRFGTDKLEFASKAEKAVLSKFSSASSDSRLFISNAPLTLDKISRVSPVNFFEVGGGRIDLYDLNFDTVTRFECFENYSADLTKSRSWATRDLLMLEPKNWKSDSLAIIRSAKNTKIFSQMIEVAGLEGFFQALTRKDAILVPSDAAIKSTLSEEGIARLLDPANRLTLQAAVRNHVIEGGWSIGDYGANSRTFSDANGDKINIGIRKRVPGSNAVVDGGFYSLINGKNNGIAVDGNSNCDFDWVPVPTTNGIIYPSLCFRTLSIAD